jgi:hypothetical protein
MATVIVTTSGQVTSGDLAAIGRAIPSAVAAEVALRGAPPALGAPPAGQSSPRGAQELNAILINEVRRLGSVVGQLQPTLARAPT